MLSRRLITYDKLYSKLGMNDGEKNIQKLAKTRGEKNLNGVKCIKDEDQRVLIKDGKVILINFLMEAIQKIGEN